MNKRLKLYNVNLKYIRNLHNVDDHVPSISPQIGKQNRPFLGIIILINGSKYCIPLSSNSISIKQWKLLCAKELDWCQSNCSEIERLANELHRKYCSGKPFQKRKICLNFPALEQECNKARILN